MQRAAPARLDTAQLKVVPVAEDLPARQAELVGPAPVLHVAPLQVAARRVLEHVLPERLGVADEDRVRVALRLVGDEHHLVAAEDRLDAAPAVLGGDLVGALRRVGLDRDADEIGRVVEVDLFDPLVVEGDVDPVGRDAGQRRHRQRLHLPGVDVLVGPLAADLRRDQGELHEAALPTSSSTSGGGVSQGSTSQGTGT